MLSQRRVFNFNLVIVGKGFFSDSKNIKPFEESVQEGYINSITFVNQNNQQNEGIGNLINLNIFPNQVVDQPTDQATSNTIPIEESDSLLDQISIYNNDAQDNTNFNINTDTGQQIDDFHNTSDITNGHKNFIVTDTTLENKLIDILNSGPGDQLVQKENPGDRVKPSSINDIQNIPDQKIEVVNNRDLSNLTHQQMDELCENQINNLNFQQQRLNNDITGLTNIQNNIISKHEEVITIIKDNYVKHEEVQEKLKQDIQELRTMRNINPSYINHVYTLAINHPFITLAVFSVSCLLAWVSYKVFSYYFRGINIPSTQPLQTIQTIEPSQIQQQLNQSIVKDQIKDSHRITLLESDNNRLRDDLNFQKSYLYATTSVYFAYIFSKIFRR